MLIKPFNFNRACLVVPTTFAECLSYEQQLLFLASKINELTDAVNELDERVTALEGNTQD